jgi:FimV-like protein
MAVVAGAPDDYESLWRAARLCYHVADQAPGADKLRHFAQGADFARRAVARRPDAVEGHFWLAANDGGASRARGVFAALRTIPRIRAGMEAVLRLDDRYEDGSAFRALGDLDLQLPRLLGGDLTRAIRRLEQGVRVAPGNAAIGLSLARAYLDAGRRQEARQRLEAILQRDDAPARTREQARRLLGEL